VSLSIVTWPCSPQNSPWRYVEHSPVCRPSEGPSVGLAWGSAPWGMILVGNVTGLWSDFRIRLCENLAIVILSMYPKHFSKTHMWELIVRMLCWMARWTGGCRTQDKRTGQSFLGSRAPLLLLVVDAFPPFFCPLVSIACTYTGPHDPIPLNSVNYFPTSQPASIR